MKIAVLATLAQLALAGISQTSAGMRVSDEGLIQDLIERTYIRVLYYGDDIDKLLEGFHPEFNMYYYYDAKIQKRSLQEWMQRLREVRARQAGKASTEGQPECKFRFIDVTGYTAVAKFDVLFDGKLKYTDYLTLYRTDDRGWLIITKQFTAYN